jgi:hypothetical protein
VRLNKYMISFYAHTVDCRDPCFFLSFVFFFAFVVFFLL